MNRPFPHRLSMPASAGNPWGTREASPWNTAAYKPRRSVGPIPPAISAQIMREDDEINRADGPTRSPLSGGAKLVRAFCLAVAVGNIVFWGGQLVRGLVS